MNAPLATPPPDELFRFHPQASNPELWRTSVPLIVRERCRHHKGLIATWTAIHWLTVLYTGNGQRAFGVREIAQEARVGRNELTGSSGHIQRLVDLGLIQIVGYAPMPHYTQRCPIYHIDLTELERLSIAIIPDLLQARGLRPPPRPAPDPRQLALFATAPEPPANGTGHPSLLGGARLHETGPAPAHHTPSAAPQTGTRLDLRVLTMHENGPGTPENAPSGPGSAVVPPMLVLGMPGNGPALPENGPCSTNNDGVPPMLVLGMPGHGPGTPANGPCSCDSATTTPENGPCMARIRDVGGTSERTKEGMSEDAILSHALFQTFVAQAATVVIQTLTAQGVIGAPTATPTALPPAAPDLPPPPAPNGMPVLPKPVLTLWQGNRAEVSPREQHQLTMIAAEFDASSGGYGSYWLGRAIMLADLYLTDRGHTVTLIYLRAMLRRWQREDSWGSDLERKTPVAPATPAAPTRPRGRRVPETATVEPTAAVTDSADCANAAAVAPDQDRPAAEEHPAIRAYVRAFGKTPNAVQAQLIVETVTDHPAWQQVLTDWLANGWQPGGVAKMIDRYRKATDTPPAQDEDAPDIRAIYYHPTLSDTERSAWIDRYHAAITPAEKRAVLARLEKAHPYDRA